MEIRRLQSNDKDSYNRFVSDHSSGSFLQSWEWGEWQAYLGKAPYRYLVIENNEVIAAAQFVEVTTPLGAYLYCPYGPLWKHALNPHDSAAIFNIFTTTIAHEFSHAIFIRVEPTQPLPAAVSARPAAHIQPPQTLMVNLTRDETDLLASFHPKTRYNIRVAERQGVTIETHRAPEPDVVDLIMQTAKRQNFRSYPTSYINSLWKFFSEHPGDLAITGYLAKKNSTPLASAFMIDFGTTRMYLFGGSSYEHRRLMAPFLLHWKAMLDAKHNHLSHYDLGASETASGRTAGFMRFKTQFGPEVKEFGGTHDIVLKPTWYTVYNALRWLNRFGLHFFKK
jgi:lipid II:glycine glycyltransferase (peptidoglycan interpeptide bridge formation enzyme)